MTILQSENFDVGTNGNAINLANTIFGSQLNAVYAAGITSGDTGHAALINPATTQSGHLVNDGFTATGKSMMRMTFMITSLPSTDTIIARIDNGDTVTGVKGGDILITAAGKLRLRNGSTQVQVGTSTIPLNTPVALEWLVDPAGNTQTVRYFTTLGHTASPVETISGAYTVVEQATQYLVGKNTGSTWAGGITVDGYKRGDDWWATATADAWNEHFVGTTGANFATDANVDQIVNTAPKFVVGGPHVDQKVIGYLAGLGNDSRIRSVGFGSGATDGLDRFYFSVDNQPTERQGIWASSGTTVFAFHLVIAPGSGTNNFQVELWRSEDYKNPFSDTNQPLGTSGDMQIDVWHRIDCRVNEDASGEHAEIRIFKGPAKNLDFGNETFTLTGLSDVGTPRYRWLIGKATASGGTAVGVFFDEWRGHPTEWVGPLDSSEQFDPPVGVNWAVSQWRDPDMDGVGVEVPLTMTQWHSGAERPIDITKTTVQTPILPPPTLRFSGDPGVGKIYLGWNSGPTDEWEYHYALQSELQAVDPGGIYAPDSTIAGGWRRIFRPGGFDSDPGPGYTPKPDGDNPWGNATDSHWSLARQTAANCDIVCINFVFDSISGDFLNGIFDPWIDIAATKIQEAFDKYGAATIITPSNEPDQGQKGHNNDYNFYLRLRKVSRRLHFELLARGVDRDAFEISGPNPMGGTHQNHVANFANHKADGFAQSGTSTHGNINTVYQMLPNWKGTITEAGGTFWKNAYDPNPADFWLPGDTDTDQWGYGDGPTARVQVVNSYCDHGWQGQLADMTQAAYEAHVFSDSTQGYGSQNDFHGGHAGAQQRFLRALYGGDGFPLIVGEWGYYGRDPLVGGTNVVDMPLTREAGERYIADLIADNVVAISWWRNDNTRTVNGTTYTGAPGPHSFGYRHANGEASGTIVVDGPAQSNMNRKMFSVMFQQAGVKLPTTKGSDTPAGGKPLASQHN